MPAEARYLMRASFVIWPLKTRQSASRPISDYVTSNELDELSLVLSELPLLFRSRSLS